MRETKLHLTCWTTLIGVAFLVAACGSGQLPDGVSADEPVADESLAITNPMAPTSCDAKGLNPPSTNTCAGPWQYTKFDSEFGRSKFCGNHTKSDCIERNSCVRWGNGIEEKDPAPRSTGLAAKKVLHCWHRYFMAPGEPDGHGGRTPPTFEEGDSCDFLTEAEKKSWCMPATELAKDERTIDGIVAAHAAEVDDEGPPNATTVKRSIAQKVKGVRQVGMTKTPTGVKGPSMTWNGRTYTNYEFTATYNCSLSVTDVEPKKAVNDTCTCKTTAYPECNHPKGTGHVEYTAPGALKPQGTEYGWVDGDAPVHCTTCDDEPAGSKYACLFNTNNFSDSSLPPNVDKAKFREAIEARLKLMIEYHGADYNITRTSSLGAYTDDTDATMCTVKLPTLPTACVAAIKTAGYMDELRMCNNLTRVDAQGNLPPAATVAKLLPICHELLDNGSNTALQTACGAAFHDKIEVLERQLMDRGMDVLSYGADGFTNLDKVLANLDSWWSNAKGTHRPAAWMDAETSAIMDLFWVHVADAVKKLPAVGSINDTAHSPNNVDTLLGQVSDTGILSDTLVLEAASSVPMFTPPLLAIVNDSLRNIADRLDVSSEIHDLVCRYRACGTSTAVEIWDLLGAINDRTALTAALGRATKLATSIVPEHVHLRNALTNFATSEGFRHLSSAYASEGNTGGPITLVDSGPHGPIATSLAGVVHMARARSDSFRRIGRFVGDNLGILNMGVQDKSTLLTRVTEHQSNLDKEITKFNAGRLEAVRNLAQEWKDGGAQASITSRMDLVVARIAQATSELNGLSLLESKDREEWSTFVSEFIDKNKDQAYVNANVTPLPDITVDASWPNSHGNWSKTLEQGDTLRLGITSGDKYSPSCALSATFPAPREGGQYGLDMSSAETGPEGWVVSWDRGNYQAHDYSKSSTDAATLSVTACESGGFATPYSATTVQACASYSHTWSSTDSNSHGEDSRTSASFSGGMHLPNTPYPEAPVGALLLVFTPTATAGVSADVQVVGNDFTYLAPGNGVATLVVNDAACGTASGSLIVHATYVHSLGNIIKQLAFAMDDALAALRSRSADLIAQGTILPAQEQLLREEVATAVHDATNIDLTELPAPVQAFVRQWTDTEIVSLYRHLAIQKHQEEVHMAVLELEGIRSELASALGSSRLLNLATRLYLRELKSNRLATYRARLIDDLLNVVPVALELRYPRALATIDTPTNAGPILDKLEKLDFAASTDDFNQLVADFGDIVLDTYRGANDPEFGTHQVVLAFPRPEDYFMPPTCPEGRVCGPEPYPGLWRAVELTRAKQFWDTFAKPINHPARYVEFAVSPSDLYTLGGAAGQLSCQEGVPVIKKVALYAQFYNGDVMNLGASTEVELGRSTTFPTATGSPVYITAEEDDSWRFPSFPIIGGGEDDALSVLNGVLSTEAAGYSPFTTYRINLMKIGEPNSTGPVENIERFLLVYELSKRPVANVAVDVCRRL
jgi:hypothetical protein